MAVHSWIGALAGLVLASGCLSVAPSDDDVGRTSSGDSLMVDGAYRVLDHGLAQ